MTLPNRPELPYISLLTTTMRLFDKYDSIRPKHRCATKASTANIKKGEIIKNTEHSHLLAIHRTAS